MGDIGTIITTREYEPFPEEEPMHEPSPQIAPAEPVFVPEEEPVPA